MIKTLNLSCSLYWHLRIACIEVLHLELHLVWCHMGALLNKMLLLYIRWCGRVIHHLEPLLLLSLVLQLLNVLLLVSKLIILRLNILDSIVLLELLLTIRIKLLAKLNLVKLSRYLWHVWYLSSTLILHRHHLLYLLITELAVILLTLSIRSLSVSTVWHSCILLWLLLNISMSRSTLLSILLMPVLELLLLHTLDLLLGQWLLLKQMLTGSIIFKSNLFLIIGFLMFVLLRINFIVRLG